MVRVLRSSVHRSAFSDNHDNHDSDQQQRRAEMKFEISLRRLLAVHSADCSGFRNCFDSDTGQSVLGTDKSTWDLSATARRQPNVSRRKCPVRLARKPTDPSILRRLIPHLNILADLHALEPGLLSSGLVNGDQWLVTSGTGQHVQAMQDEHLREAFAGARKRLPWKNPDGDQSGDGFASPGSRHPYAAIRDSTIENRGSDKPQRDLHHAVSRHTRRTRLVAFGQIHSPHPSNHFRSKANAESQVRHEYQVNTVNKNFSTLMDTMTSLAENLEENDGLKNNICSTSSIQCRRGWQY